jgi:hypothetical protein
MALTVTGRTGLGANYRGGYQYRGRKRRARGMGQCSFDPDTGDTTCDSTVSDSSTLPLSSTTGPVIGLSPTTTTTSPTLSSAALQTDISSALTKGFQTLQLALMPSGSYLVQGPNGTYTISNNVPGAIPSLANLFGTGTAGSSGLTTLILLGGGLLLVMALAEGGHR